MTTGAGPTKPRWWQDLRWIAAGLVMLLIGTLAWGLFGLFGPELPIRVARETTYLTAPLAADGLPDYEAALLASYGPTPPPEENAAVMLLQTCWPLGMEAADLPAVCKAIGIPDTPPTDPLRLDPAKDAAAGIDAAMLHAAGEWPWTTEALPAVAAWLTKHETQIDRLVAAADRPHYWLPSPSLLDGKPEMLVGVLLSDLQGLRGVARVLGYRARWHIGENRPAAAWRDIVAIRRLARLLAPPGRGPQFFVTQFVAIGLDATADLATRQVLAMPGLPAEVLAAIRRDLEALGPTVAWADGLAGERLFGVDTPVWLARRTPGGRRARMELVGGSLMDSGDAALRTSLDWNVVLERLNACYDGLESSCRLPTHQSRVAATDAQTRAISALLAAPGRSAWSRAGDVLLQVCSRGHRSDRVADQLLGLLAPAVSGWLKAATRNEAQLALTKTAAALAAWQADRGADTPPYPERLDDLVPRYLAAVPVDPFTDKPFIYERRGDGYLLASVGDNGVYDGGNDVAGWVVGGEWKDQSQGVDRDAFDLVVRMPVPPAPAAAATSQP
jgi:hypothetical protein